MITRFHVKNYKALRDVTLDLTPIHVLIGPNNSGKTSILEAINALCRSVDHELIEAFMGPWKGQELVWHGYENSEVDLAVSIHDDSDFNYSLSCKFVDAPSRTIAAGSEWYSEQSSKIPLESPLYRYSHVRMLTSSITQVNTEQSRAAKRVVDALSGVHFHRWEPRLLALPAAPDSNRRFRMDPSGFGLVLCLDDILGFDRDLFASVESRFKAIFPDVKSIKLIPEPAYKAPIDYARAVPLLQPSDGKGIYFQFTDSSALVPAAQASDGLLLVLAYLTLMNLPKPPRVILVEEPENGIHPKRLGEVLGILRDLIQGQSHTQIVLTTHSPYVLDLFRPEEVTLCRKDEDGAISVHRLSESAAVREQLSVFGLGEIWAASGDEVLAGRAGGGSGK
jgi:predicted ATPase